MQQLWAGVPPGLCLSSLGGPRWGSFHRCLERRGALPASRSRYTSGRGVGKGPQDAYGLPSSPLLVGPCCPDRVPTWQVYLLPDLKPSRAPPCSPCCTSCPAAPGIQLPTTGTPPDCELFEGRAWCAVGVLIKVCETDARVRSRRFLWA